LGFELYENNNVAPSPLPHPKEKSPPLVNLITILGCNDLKISINVKACMTQANISQGRKRLLIPPDVKSEGESVLKEVRSDKTFRWRQTDFTAVVIKSPQYIILLNKRR
jgi:hypothetical protein